MVWACGVSRRGADAAIFFLDQRVVGELLARRIAPERLADMLVQPFGKGFGKAIGERFEQYVRIIILVGLKPRQMWLDAVNADSKATDPVALRVDEISKTHVGAAFALGNLLAEKGEADVGKVGGRGHPRPLQQGLEGRRRRCLAPLHAFVEGLGVVLPLLEMHNHIIAVATTGPKPCNTARRQPFLIDQRFEHRLRIDPQRLRRFADHAIGQDRGIIAVQFPRAEKRRPVDDIGKISQVPGVKHMHAGLFGRRWLQMHVGGKRIGARIFDDDQCVLPLARTDFADMRVVVSEGFDIGIAARVADQRGRHTDGAARIENVDDRAVIGFVDAQRGVHL